ncbi:MAG TPA: type II secretion system F family protein [Actinomycetota bacterium]|nr:type II secretion system F family protein [Actinomycetota bacterium]
MFAERAIRERRFGRSMPFRPPAAERRNGPRRWRRLWPLAIPVPVLAVGPLPGLATVAAIAVGFHVRSRRRAANARRRREEQLADAVAAIAAGIRSGLSLTQSLAHARDEAGHPLREDLTNMVSRIETGVPIREALSGWAEQLDSEDARLIVGVLDLHRRSGGDLPTVLDNLVRTLRDRRAAQREVRALTAQARLSAVILGSLPIGFFAFLVLTSRKEMLDAMAAPLGRIAVVVGLGLEGVAFLWIRRLLGVA